MTFCKNQNSQHCQHLTGPTDYWVSSGRSTQHESLTCFVLVSGIIHETDF